MLSFQLIRQEALRRKAQGNEGGDRAGVGIEIMVANPPKAIPVLQPQQQQPQPYQYQNPAGKEREVQKIQGNDHRIDRLESYEAVIERRLDADLYRDKGLREKSLAEIREERAAAAAALRAASNSPSPAAAPYPIPMQKPSSREVCHVI